MNYTVKGREFSEETIVEALQKYCNFEEKKKSHIFQSGDIVTCNGFPRIILKQPEGGLTSYCSDGSKMTVGQRSFESYDYRKIGTLEGFAREKPDEN